MPTPTGAELFVQAARQLGIDTLFTLVGDHLNAALAAARNGGLRVIDFRHESGVTHAAEAWGRLTRQPALALVTGGPGHTNALTGLATAHQSLTPMILVSGAPSSALAGRQVFQVIDQLGMAAPITKWAAQPAAPNQIPYYLGRAWREALDGRMGPTHLSIPVNCFEAEASTTPLSMPPAVAKQAPAPHSSDIDHALHLLSSAKRPVVIAGSGVWWADAKIALETFLQKTNLGCYTVTMGRGVIDDHWHTAMGHADGAINKAVQTVFPQADVVLVLGKRVDYRIALGGPRLFSPQAKFLQVDLHAPELGHVRSLDLGICADARVTLDSFNTALGRKTWKPNQPWLDSQRAARRQWQATLESIAAGRRSPIHPAALYRELRTVMPPDVLLSWDGGDFTHWGRCSLPARVSGGWFRLGPLAAIGSALPNAIAMQLAHPDRRVLMISGDGALGFYLAELETLVRYNLPVVIIVGNDAGWGLERELQGEVFGSTVACELRASRYDLIMKAFGGGGENITRLDQFAPAVKRAFASGKPYLLNVRTRGARSPFTEWQLAGKQAPK